MLLRCLNLLQFGLTGALLTTVSVAFTQVPVPGRDVRLPTPPPEIRATATVTAYSSSPDETWGDPFITASGRHVFDGLVACPRALPFGTKVRIDGRTYVCHDRLHRKYDERFDIWMPTKNAALAFGKQRLHVEVIKG